MKVQKSSLWGVLAGSLLLCVMGSAVAAPAEPVKINLQVFKVVQQDGKEVLIEGKSAKPGDVLEYQAVYNNVSQRSVGNLVANLPVPEGLEYIDKSARPAGAEASLDGKTPQLMPLMRKNPVTGAAELVALKEYRALHWRVGELKPGASLKMSLRARVLK